MKFWKPEEFKNTPTEIYQGTQTLDIIDMPLDNYAKVEYYSYMVDLQVRDKHNRLVQCISTTLSCPTGNYLSFPRAKQLILYLFKVTKTDNV